MNHIYNNRYYECYGERHDEDYSQFKAGFERIADQIIEDFNPKTAIDFGCAWGHLVVALRDRGVEAYGIDISEYAISQVREDVSPYCAVKSATEGLPEGFPKEYDLVISIEMVEHLHEKESLEALKAMCSHGNRILFSSSPDDFLDATHYNVQQEEYWAKHFAELHFFRSLDYDARYVSPQASLFEKLEKDCAMLVEDYERKLKKTQGNMRNRVLGIENALAGKDDQIAQLEEIVSKKEQWNLEALETIEKLNTEQSRLCDEISRVQKELVNSDDSLGNERLRCDRLSIKQSEIQKEFGEYVNLARYLQGENARLEEEQRRFLNSRSWRYTKPLRALRRSFDRLFKNTLKSTNPTPHSAQNGSSLEDMTVSKYLSAHYRNLQPIPCYYSENILPRVNLVTDRLDKARLLGGVATSLIVASIFCAEYNLPLRIITRDNETNPQVYKDLLRLHKIECPSDVLFYSDYDRDENGDKNFRIEISKGDIFIATSWWSAAAINRTSLRNRFFYIIQEVETFFYPHGDEHLLCSEIMKSKNIDFLVNTSLLYDYFEHYEPNVHSNGIPFEPAFPFCTPDDNARQTGKRKLLFYARPDNPRNLYLFGLDILNKSIQQGILNTDTWEICFAGQDIPDVQFDNGYYAKNLGLLDWQEYSKLLSEVDLAFSLMYTPHPSYPPYDVAASGGVVVSNRCCNKTSFAYSENVLLSDLKEEDLLRTLCKATELAFDDERRSENMKNDRIIRSWNETLLPVIKNMRESVADVLS